MTDSSPFPTGVKQPRSLAHTLLRGGSWVIAGRVLSSGGTFALSVLLARMLQPAEVGAYFLALSLATALGIVGRFGLERVALTTIANRCAVGDGAGAVRVAHRVLLLALVTTGLTALGVGAIGARALAYVFPSSSLASLTTFIAAWTFVLSFETLLAEVYRGLNRIPLASLLGGALSRTIAVVALIITVATNYQLSLEGTLSLSIGAVMVAVVLSGTRLRADVRSHTHGRHDIEGFRTLVRAAFPLAASNLGFFVMTSVDLWIVGAHLDSAAVGRYAVASRLVLLVGSSVTIANAVLPPIIARLMASGDRARLERVLRGVAALAAVPSGLILGAYMLAGGPLLATLYGHSYADAWPVLAALSAGQLSAVWAGSCGYLLMISGQLRAVMWTALAGGFLATAGGLFAVGRFGGTGVAVASALGLIAQQVLMLIVTRQRCGVWTHAGVRPLVDALVRARATLLQ